MFIKQKCIYSDNVIMLKFIFHSFAFSRYSHMQSYKNTHTDTADKSHNYINIASTYCILFISKRHDRHRHPAHLRLTRLSHPVSHFFLRPLINFKNWGGESGEVRPQLVFHSTTQSQSHPYTVHGYNYMSTS